MVWYLGNALCNIPTVFYCLIFPTLVTNHEIAKARHSALIGSGLYQGVGWLESIPSPGQVLVGVGCGVTGQGGWVGDSRILRNEQILPTALLYITLPCY